MAKKYIDAEKLLAEIRKLRSESCISEGDDYYEFAKSEIIDIIVSLQQEQPKEICFKCIYYGKDDGYCYYPHGGMQSKINENGVYECTGFYEKEKEQPGVDLDKEIESFFYPHVPWGDYSFNEQEDIKEWSLKIARHFYELGKNNK